MFRHIRNLYPVKVKDLASRQYRGENFVLFGGCQDEDGEGGRLFQRFQDRVDRELIEHVDLIDDVYLVFAHFRWDANLFNQSPDVVDQVVGRGVQLVDGKRRAFCKRLATRARAARLDLAGNLFTVDGFGQYARAAGFTYSTRAAEQKGLCQLVVLDCVLERARDVLLPHDGVKGSRAILSGRNDKIIHR